MPNAQPLSPTRNTEARSVTRGMLPIFVLFASFCSNVFTEDTEVNEEKVNRIIQNHFCSFCKFCPVPVFVFIRVHSWLGIKDRFGEGAPSAWLRAGYTSSPRDESVSPNGRIRPAADQMADTRGGPPQKKS
jgi:hypothetical protein